MEIEFSKSRSLSKLIDVKRLHGMICSTRSVNSLFSTPLLVEGETRP